MFSILHHLVRLKVHEGGEKLYILWLCPRCSNVAAFYLLSSETNVTLAGLPIGKPHEMLELRTGCCRYDLAVPIREKAFLEQVRELTVAVINREITEQAYRDAIVNVPADFVKHLRALTEIWRCQNCGEENPKSFPSCWNCQRQCTTAIVDVEPEPPRIPPAGNPWEQ